MCAGSRRGREFGKRTVSVGLDDEPDKMPQAESVKL